MDIISKLVEIETEMPVENDFIEEKLNEMGISPLRWAIVDCIRQGGNKVTLTISLACENL